jgi:DNA-binding response OmpR family regulator
MNAGLALRAARVGTVGDQRPRDRRSEPAPWLDEAEISTWQDSTTVLVVDHDEGVRTTLESRLRRDAFDVMLAADGQDALRIVDECAPDVLIVGECPPLLSSLELCSMLRARADEPPVVVLGRSGELAERVSAFKAGADDYLAVPVAYAELVLRLRAHVRRARRSPNRVLRFGDLVLDAGALEVRRAGRRLPLSRREFQLMHVFMQHPQHVLSRQQLRDEVWGDSATPGTNVVDVYVLYLRRKLERGGLPRLLHNVRGAGYLLRQPDLADLVTVGSGVWSVAGQS